MRLKENWACFAAWVNGEPASPREVRRFLPRREVRLSLPQARPGALRRFYYICCTFVCIILAAALFYAVLCLPMFGEAGSPTDNEVSLRYIESGVEDTGAVNLTAGMILEYRAFDTLGEMFVLFSSVLCVVILLRRDEKNFGPEEQRSVKIDDLFDTSVPNIILQTISVAAVPLIFLFGLYLMVTGHLSPGGGFTGGALLSGGLILYSMAYGPKRTGDVFSYRTFRRLLFWGLLFCTASKAFSFFCGANGISIWPGYGQPGTILSAGWILPLNLGIGLVTTAALYGCYALFSRGDFK